MVRVLRRLALDEDGIGSVPGDRGVGQQVGGDEMLQRRHESALAPQSLVQEGLGWSNVTAFNERYGRIETRITEKSGVRGDDVFYSRCNFPDRRRGDMRCIFLQYPERETKAWDTIVTRISLSLRGESISAGMASSERSRIGRHSRRR